MVMKHLGISMMIDKAPAQSWLTSSGSLLVKITTTQQISTRLPAHSTFIEATAVATITILSFSITPLASDLPLLEELLREVQESHRFQIQVLFWPILLSFCPY